MIRDDVSWSKGTHFFQFGGIYQRNWDYHQRTDNGGGINYQTVYWMGASVGSTNGMDMSGFVPAAVSAAKLTSTWSRDYAIALGVPGVTQIAYTRTGPNLTLNPPNTPAFDQSTIPFYNLYFSDSWRMKPTFTLSYGLGWTLEMPPVEAKGKQISLVDANAKLIDTQAYLNAREQAALAGQVYNPQVGFALVGNVAGHPKYPYNPFYKSFSPRVAAAWNPSFDNGLLGSVFGQNKTVIRGGYSILYGRLNGVDLVLVPLLGTGLIQAVQCVKMSQWHGITLQSNFTYGKALGTGSQVQATSQYTISDPYDYGRNYGLQPWDRKFLFNIWFLYQPPIYQSQHGIIGHLLGGWSFSPILDTGSGLPLGVYAGSYWADGGLYGGGQTFGASDASNFGSYENAINMCASNAFGSSRHNNPVPSSLGGNGYGPSLFRDPQAAYNCFRNPILGIDNGHNGGAGNLRGQPFWNVDFSVKKNVMITERFSAEFGAIFTNIFNHNQLYDPLLALGDTGDWGALEGQVNNPRKIELGVRVRF